MLQLQQLILSEPSPTSSVTTAGPLLPAFFPRPLCSAISNTYEYESIPLVQASGFREYDARWLLGTEINFMGIQALGIGLGTLLRELGGSKTPPRIIVGHDFRAYSASVKYALISGLLATGSYVYDIGLALSPMAYFAQHALNVPAVAMVTASHNDNGWTGVKMGAEPSLTFGPDEMKQLKEIVLQGKFYLGGSGAYTYIDTIPKQYIQDITHRPPFKQRRKVVVACGNGTAGAFAPQIFEKLNCHVIPLDVAPDYAFPNYNPNPEDLKMLRAMAKKVQESGADLGIGFDGDGDRCGFVTHTGEEIFADKIGLLLARYFSQHYPQEKFIVDVKSTGLFSTDSILHQTGASIEYWKTGHSYMKRRLKETQALAAFEKSGHFFFNAPLGRGYDDGIVAAIHLLAMLDEYPDHKLIDLYHALPKTWSSPTMAAYCPDSEKYAIVDRIKAEIEVTQKEDRLFAGQPIRHLLCVNGVRIELQDGTWGLLRPSSNKPEIVVVVESPISESQMKTMFTSLDSLLRQYKEVGSYNQHL